MRITRTVPTELFTKVKALVVLLFVSVLFFFAVFSYTRPYADTRVYAATSSNLNFQARLLTSSGNTVPDGNYNIEFKLYNVDTGGSVLWTETRDFPGTDDRVRVVNGYFSVNLGSVTAFPGTINWDQEHWITMNVGGSTTTPAWDGEMTPRLKLTAVPYSFRSALADALKNGSGSLLADDLLHKAPAAPQSVNSTVAGLRFDQIGSGGLIQLRGDGVDVFTVSKTGDGYYKGALDVDGALTAGGGNAFSVNTSGDITSAFTALNGTSTTNGGSGLGTSTSLIVTSAANFDVGNYVQVNDTNCGGTGINPCYAKITAKAGNTLTITPALRWTTGKTVNEYHIPELGGINTAQTLANRYGRGYFIAGVATGNGTTYYNEGDISSSLDTFDLLNTDVATLNIGGAATAINLGSASTVLRLPGTVDIEGATVNIGTATQAGGLIIQNGAAKTGTIQVGTLAANRTYTLPDADGTICLTTTCTGGGGPTDAFVKDGNSFGVTSVLGTNDNFGLAFETNAIQRLLIDTNGNVGIGTSGSPSQLLSIGGTTGNFTVNSSGAVNAVGLTSSSGLTVTSGGASITGGLNNNDGGITNAGSITGVGTNITALADLTIASGGTSNLTLNSVSGLMVLGATTLQTVDNLLLDLSKATDTVLSLQNSGAGITNLNLVDGGLQTGGTLRLTNAGELQNITGLTVSSGDAFFNGNVTIGDTTSDRLTIASHILGANALVFQGATDNGFATTLAITDPTANHTITLPDASGTLVLDARSITTAAGSGLTGGGNLSVDRSLSLDINGVTTKTNVNPNDYLVVHDDTTASIRKISRNDFLQGLIGALQYRGTWDASTNTPTLTDATGTQGHMYAVSVAGTQNFGGGPGITFGVGDFAIHNGTDWERAPSSSAVTSVFGRTGAITAQNGDYTASQITNVAAGNISATTIQAAINELDTEKMASLNGLTAVTQTFANDTNVTITSSGSTHTLGWTGQLSVARGGTGTNTFTTNGVLYGNGTGALQVSAAGTAGQVLVANASGVPTFVSFSGDVTVSSTGVTTIGANTINLTTDTVGNYVANLGVLTGLTTTGNTGEGSTPTLAVTYGSLANTAVQGNTGLTITAGTNLSGGGAITLGAGGTVTINTIANPTFSSSVTTPVLTSTAGLSISSGGTGDITLDSVSNKIIIAGTDTTLERTGGGSYTIDLKDNAATSLVLSNSSAGGSSVANLNLADGELLIAGTSVFTNGRALQNITGITNVGGFTTSGGVASLNNASNFATNINTGTSTGTVTIGGGSAPLVINSTNFDVSSAGALSGITTINTSGLVTSVGLNSGTGLIQGTGGLTISGAAISLNASSNFATNINTGTSTGTVTIGGGSAPLAINSTAFDVTAAGALSGITTIGLSGAITGATATNTINGLIINAGALSGVTSINMSGTLTLGASSTIVANTRTGITIAACTAGQYVGNGVRVDDGITTAGTCRDDATGISDVRVKKDITSLESSLDKIKDINVVSFNFKRDELPELNLDRGLQYGVIAQELERIFPELVKEREDGYKEVSFQGLSFYNLKAVAEIAKYLDSNGNASFSNATISNNLTVKGVLEAGTIRADHIEGLDYLGRFESIESRVGALETRAQTGTGGQNIDLNNLTAGVFTASGPATFKDKVSIAGEADVQRLTVNLDLIARGSIEIHGPATFKEAAIFEKNIMVYGESNVLGYSNVQGLTVNLDLIVRGSLKLDGPATFKEAALFEKSATFEDSVKFKGQVTFSNDTAGYVTIRKDELHASVLFRKKKAGQPVVSISVGNGKFVQYSYNNVTDEGFDIVLEKPATEDLTFSWVAVSTEEVASAPQP